MRLVGDGDVVRFNRSPFLEAFLEDVGGCIPMLREDNFNHEGGVK